MVSTGRKQVGRYIRPEIIDLKISGVSDLNNPLGVVVTDVHPGLETPLEAVDYHIRLLDSQPFQNIRTFGGERRITRGKIVGVRV